LRPLVNAMVHSLALTFVDYLSTDKAGVLPWSPE
jgi:hypothetical protein